MSDFIRLLLGTPLKHKIYYPLPITHRYLNELQNIENNQIFCNEPIDRISKVLIIGTFNPSDDSCTKENDAHWFYGRSKSKFWRYFPMALTGNSLHPSDTHAGHTETWMDYCVKNKIVIIDLIKSIDVDDVLPNFGDRYVDCKINNLLSNVAYFNVRVAFRNITFEKVLYSLTWSDKQIIKMRILRDRVNQTLLETGSIQNESQIKYCLTPSRYDAYQSWYNAINA